MLAIVSVFWRICLFKTGPDVIPGNNFLLGMLVVLNIAVIWTGTMLLQAIAPISPEITNQMNEREIEAMTSSTLIMVRALITVMATIALTWTILSLAGHSNRAAKVLSAIFGCDTLLTILTVAIATLTEPLVPTLTQFAIFGFFVWTLTIVGFIFHRALEISYGFGILTALFVMTFSFAISQVTLNL